MPSLKTVIENVKSLIQLLEIVEEFRDVSLAEWNFRAALKAKFLSLLEQQKTYWKQRGAIKWAKLGDVGTKIFHANATIRHRGNLITQLKSRDRSTLTSHKDKELLMISKKGQERQNLLGLPLTHHCCWREGIT